MARVVVLLVGLDPDVLDLSDGPAAATESRRAAIRARIDRNLATLRRRGYIADFYGVPTGTEPPVSGPQSYGKPILEWNGRPEPVPDCRVNDHDRIHIGLARCGPFPMLKSGKPDFRGGAASPRH